MPYSFQAIHIACSAEARNNNIEKRGIIHEKYKN
jgi:hypothetical protein